MVRRDPRYEASQIEVTLAQLRAANDLFETPGWAVYMRAIEIAKKKAIDVLVSDKDANLHLEQRVIAIYTMLQTAGTPNRLLEERLSKSLEALHKEAESMHDAGLLDP